MRFGPPADERRAGSIALRFAWRDLRHGARALRGFGVFLGCLALGVAAIAGVQSTASSIVTGLRADGREILGGDLALRSIYQELAPAERRLLERGVGGDHALRGDAHHGAPAGRRGERAGRAQGGGRPVPAVRPARDAGRRGRRRGRLRSRRRWRAAARPGGRWWTQRSPIAWTSRPAMRSRSAESTSTCAGRHRARARPGRLRGAVRVLAPGPGESRRARGHAVAARGQPRLSPVRGAPRAGGPSGGGAGGARRDVPGLGLAGAHLRQRGARHPAHDRTSRLVPEPGRPDRAPGGRAWGSATRCGPGSTRGSG